MHLIRFLQQAQSHTSAGLRIDARRRRARSPRTAGARGSRARRSPCRDARPSTDGTDVAGLSADRQGISPQDCRHGGWLGRYVAGQQQRSQIGSCGAASRGRAAPRRRECSPGHREVGVVAHVQVAGDLRVAAHGFVDERVGQEHLEGLGEVLPGLGEALEHGGEVAQTVDRRLLRCLDHPHADTAEPLKRLEQLDQVGALAVHRPQCVRDVVESVP